MWPSRATVGRQPSRLHDIPPSASLCRSGGRPSSDGSGSWLENALIMVATITSPLTRRPKSLNFTGASAVTAAGSNSSRFGVVPGPAIAAATAGRITCDGQHDAEIAPEPRPSGSALVGYQPTAVANRAAAPLADATCSRRWGHTLHDDVGVLENVVEWYSAPALDINFKSVAAFSEGSNAPLRGSPRG